MNEWIKKLLLFSNQEDIFPTKPIPHLSSIFFIELGEKWEHTPVLNLFSKSIS